VRTGRVGMSYNTRDSEGAGFSLMPSTALPHQPASAKRPSQLPLRPHAGYWLITRDEARQRFTARLTMWISPTKFTERCRISAVR